MGWEVVTSKPPIAGWSILSWYSAAGTIAVCSLPPLTTLGTPNPVCSQRREEAITPADGSKWPSRVDVEDLLWGEVHCLEAVDSHPRDSVLNYSHPECMAKAPVTSLTTLPSPLGLRPGLLLGP